jgi:diacylglycerol O-acyltransferase
MAYSHYERLTALDALFLQLEEPHVHMHVGAIALFEATQLTSSEGALDIDGIRMTIDSALAESPRFRQRLARIPLFDQPVWIDDDRFNLSYHLRHASLPQPGSIRELKRLAGRLMSQKLDRFKPLWEMWVVDGVEDGRFALILKAHHCMVDGIAGIDLLARILSTDADATSTAPHAWIPRPAPEASRLVGDEIARRAMLPLSMMRAASRMLWQPLQTAASAQEALLGVGEVLTAGLRPTASTPLNADIGPHRRFDWARIDMQAIKDIRRAFGGKLNDVVLATAAGAIGRFLRQRGEDTVGMVFRAQIPVNIRNESERGKAGNRVVMLLADLPVGEPDPKRRLERVIRTTEALKASRQRAGVEILEELSDRGLSPLFYRFAQLATSQRAFNVVVTNVPGPPVPVYLLGARMLEIYPLVPLAGNQALGIALFSYSGQLCWGFNADWDSLPDLHDLALGVQEEFEQLHKLATRTRD